MLVVLFCTLAFGLQGYLIQTHIHHAGEAPGIDQELTGKVFGAGNAQKQGPIKAPADDPSNCPLCQQSQLHGAYVTPTVVALLAPTLAVSTIQLAILVTVRARAITHSWQGRAPPRL